MRGKAFRLRKLRNHMVAPVSVASMLLANSSCLSAERRGRGETGKWLMLLPTPSWEQKWETSVSRTDELLCCEGDDQTEKHINFKVVRGLSADTRKQRGRKGPLRMALARSNHCARPGLSDKECI